MIALRRALAGIVGLVCGCAGSSGGPAPDAAQPAASGTPVGVTTWEFEDGRFDTFLSGLDPSSLRPRGRRAPVGEFHDTWSTSPNGRLVALGTGGQGLGITIYDLNRIRRVRGIRTGIAAEGLAWLTPARLVAVLQSNQLVVVDPSVGRVLRRKRLGRDATACLSAPTAKSSVVAARGLLVMLRGRRGATSRLLHVNAEGAVRSLDLPDGPLWGCGRAGLAVDDAGGRAFVVSRGSEVAEVDLATMTASYHRLAGTPLRDARPREVSWVDGGSLVTSGRSASGRSAGVTVVDTATWTNRVIDGTAGLAAAAGGLILTYDGDRVAVPRGRGAGVAGFDTEGRRLFHLLRGTQVNAVTAVGGRAYAISERVVRAIDLATERVAAQQRAPAARVSVTVLR